jgi:hypothetical protein
VNDSAVHAEFSYTERPYDKALSIALYMPPSVALVKVYVSL